MQNTKLLMCDTPKGPCQLRTPVGLSYNYIEDWVLLSPQPYHPHLLTGAHPGEIPQHTSAKHFSISGTVIYPV